MRRYTRPIGWPRRDPRHYRFPVPNAVWEYKLKPVEFVIFSYLCYHHSTNVLTLDVVTKGVHMTVGTVQKYLAELMDKGLITVEATSYFDQRGMKWKGNNLYTILPIQIAAEQFQQQQLHQLELDAERRHIHEQQAKLTR